MTTTAEEIAQWKAELVDLKEREKNENDPALKKDLNQRIIESNKTLNLLLAPQGTFLFPDLSRRLCVSFLSRTQSMMLNDHDVSYLGLFYFSPFCFFRSIFFLFHCVTLHPHHVSLSDAIWNSTIRAAPQVRVCGRFLFVFPLLLPNLLDVILCPISFDISLSPIQVR